MPVDARFPPPQRPSLAGARFGLMALLFAWPQVGLLAQTPSLPRDIDPTADLSPSATPQPLVEVAGTFYFGACESVHGCELWKTTGAGASLVLDIQPGVQPVAIHGVFGEAIALGSLLIVTVCEPVAGCEPWRSDGTAGGTFRLRDIQLGTTGSLPFSYRQMGGAVYFLADDGVVGRELWKTDGTMGGTTLLRDVNPGAADGEIEHLTATPTKLIFRATSPPSSTGLWRSDGSPGGTVFYSSYDIEEGASDSDFQDPFAVALGELVIFAGSGDVAAGVEPHVTDGLAMTPTLLANINGGASPSSPSSFTRVGGEVFFTAYEGFAMGGRQLWKTNGMPGVGTSRVKDIDSGGTDGRFGEPTVLGSAVLFRGFDSATVEGHELWRSDGTPGGTALLADLDPLGESFPHDFAAAAGLVFFTATTPDEGLELWKSDGTAPPGTGLVTEIQAGPSGGEVDQLRAAASVGGGRVFFSANDGVSGHELWTSQGTAGNTALVHEVHQATGGAKPQHLAAMSTGANGVVLFSAEDGNSGRELWKSDGTLGGTVQVEDIEAGAGGSDPEQLTAVAGQILFVATDSIGGRELWRSNGTAAGTDRVVDLVAGPVGAEPQGLTRLGSSVVFSADDGNSGRELWKSDGLTMTHLANLVAGGGDSNPRSFRSLQTVAGEILLFFADDAGGHLELWRTDGTSVGTSLLVDLGSGVADGELAAEGGKAFFLVLDPTNFEADLWRSDGTPGGTGPVATVGHDPPSLLAAGDLVVCSGDAYFAAPDSNFLMALWKSDGTGPGTNPLASTVNPGGLVEPRELTVYRNRVYFAARAAVGGDSGLWRSDGSGVGTVSLATFPLHPDSPTDLSVAADRLFFSALGSAAAGIEAWRSDGTVAGTTQLPDIAASVLSSSPGQNAGFVGAGLKVFFPADDHLRGIELWTVTLPDEFADGFSDGFESGALVPWSATEQ